MVCFTSMFSAQYMMAGRNRWEQPDNSVDSLGKKIYDTGKVLERDGKYMLCQVNAHKLLSSLGRKECFYFRKGSSLQSY